MLWDGGRRNRKINEIKKEIRFIDSRYRELFRIQDGDSIEITYPDQKKVTQECRFIDEYHTKVGGFTFHIREFAEHMEKQGAVYKPVGVPEKQQVVSDRNRCREHRGRSR